MFGRLDKLKIGNSGVRIFEYFKDNAIPNFVHSMALMLGNVFPGSHNLYGTRWLLKFRKDFERSRGTTCSQHWMQRWKTTHGNEIDMLHKVSFNCSVWAWTPNKCCIVFMLGSNSNSKWHRCNRTRWSSVRLAFLFQLRPSSSSSSYSAP